MHKPKQRQCPRLKGIQSRSREMTRRSSSRLSLPDNGEFKGADLDTCGGVKRKLGSAPKYTYRPTNGIAGQSLGRLCPPRPLVGAWLASDLVASLVNTMRRYGCVTAGMGGYPLRSTHLALQLGTGFAAAARFVA